MIIYGNFETKEIFQRTQILHVTEMGFELLKGKKVIFDNNEVINIGQDTEKDST